MSAATPEKENKRPRQQQRSLITRERILVCATRAFAANGFEATSTRAIAADLGIQHPLVRYHFKSKDGLWQAVVENAVSGFRQHVEQIESNTDQEAATRLREIFTAFIHFAAENHDLHLIIAGAGRISGAQLDWLVDSLRPFYKVLADLIRGAQAKGHFISGDPNMLAYLFIGTATKFYLQPGEVERLTGRNPTHPATVEEHVRICTAMFLRD